MNVRKHPFLGSIIQDEMFPGPCNVGHYCIGEVVSFRNGEKWLQQNLIPINRAVRFYQEPAIRLKNKRTCLCPTFSITIFMNVLRSLSSTISLEIACDAFIIVERSRLKVPLFGRRRSAVDFSIGVSDINSAYFSAKSFTFLVAPQSA